jgi:hypothetical protein
VSEPAVARDGLHRPLPLFDQVSEKGHPRPRPGASARVVEGHIAVAGTVLLKGLQPPVDQNPDHSHQRWRRRRRVRWLLVGIVVNINVVIVVRGVIVERPRVDREVKGEMPVMAPHAKGVGMQLDHAPHEPPIGPAPYGKVKRGVSVIILPCEGLRIELEQVPDEVGRRVGPQGPMEGEGPVGGERGANPLGVPLDQRPDLVERFFFFGAMPADGDEQRPLGRIIRVVKFAVDLHSWRVNDACV